MLKRLATTAAAFCLCRSADSAGGRRYDSRFLGDTSRYIAWTRALVTRLDPWFVDDPFAACFVGGEDAVSARLRTVDAASLGRLAIRTRFFDELIVEFCERHARCQLVLLGAGLDTRAQRLHLGSGCSVFALDARRVIRGKLAALPRNAPLRCGSLAHVACDLTDPAWADALAAAPGYRNDVPTFYVAEGLLYYLDEADVSQIVEAIARTAPPKSKFLASVISTGALKNAKKRATRAEKKVFAAFRWGVDRPLRWLRRRGCGKGRCYELGRRRRGLDLWWRRHPPANRADPAVVRPPAFWARDAARTFYVVVDVGSAQPQKEPASSIAWDAGAEAKLARVPWFVRSYVRAKTDEFAAARGLAVVTADVVDDAKRHHGR